MNIFHLNGGMRAMAAVCALSGAGIAAGGDVSLGFRDVGGVSVDSGETVFDGKLVVGDGGRFIKAGAGKLTIPVSSLDAQTDSSFAVLGGELAFAPEADASPAGVSAPPAALAEKAAFWVDETSVVVTNGADGTAYASLWRDARDMDAESPQRIYAVPKWYAPANGNPPGTKDGVDPCVVTTDAVTAVYFGGIESGQYMQWQKGGAKFSLSQIRHFFVVHGTYDCWGNVLGWSGGSRTGGFAFTGGAYSPASPAAASAHFASRMDCLPDMTTARFFLDGERIDAFAIPPKRGFQLLEGVATAYPFRMDTFFHSGFETYKKAQGGDFIAEAAVFTNRLTEAERLSVERYLLKKWNLPAGYGTYDMKRSGGNVERTRNNLRLPTARIAVASNAVFSCAAAAGAETPVLAFSGEGVVRIAGGGTLALGPDETAKWNGTFEWDGAGEIVAKGGALPPLDVAGGQVYTCANREDSTDLTRECDATTGLRLTRSDDGTAGAVHFRGDGWTKVRSVADGVARFVVEKGHVQLQGRARGTTVVPDGAVEAVVENADFELPFDFSDANYNRRYLVAGGVNGWHGAGSSFLMDTSVPFESGKTGWWSWMDKTIQRPRGGEGRVLQIVMAGGAWTSVTFPKSGRYEVSFDACSRYGSDGWINSSTGIFAGDQRPQVNLLLGADWTSAEPFATCTLGNQGFLRYRYRTPRVEAGTRVFGFKSVDTGGDACFFADNLRMTFVPDAEDPAVFEIPNGGFDEMVRAKTLPYAKSIHSIVNEAKGWTLSIDEGATPATETNSPVAVIDGGSLWRFYATTLSLYPLRDIPLGSGSLAFVSTGGVARTAFTAPAGTYRLRSRVGTLSMYGRLGHPGKESGYNADGRVRARLTRADGTAVDLGTVSAPHTSFTPAETVWATTFTLDEPEEVSLEFRQENGGGTALLDDLAFIPSERFGEGNLIANGGFENGAAGRTGWTSGRTEPQFVLNGLSYAYCHGSTHAWNQENPWAFGYNTIDGRYYLRIQNDGYAKTEVDVPSAGLYRFSFTTRTRIDGTYYTGNNFRIWMAPADDSAVTNEVARFFAPYSRNWHRESFLVNLPKAGRYVLRMDGLGSGSAKNPDTQGMFDLLSLERVVDPPEATPEMPSDMEISVAEGARLVLDFTGAVRCGPVRLGGTVLTGLLSAQTHPEYLSGAGTLDARSLGTVLIFR